MKLDFSFEGTPEEVAQLLGKSVAAMLSGVLPTPAPTVVEEKPPASEPLTLVTPIRKVGLTSDTTPPFTRTVKPQNPRGESQTVVLNSFCIGERQLGVTAATVNEAIELVECVTGMKDIRNDQIKDAVYWLEITGYLRAVGHRRNYRTGRPARVFELTDKGRTFAGFTDEDFELAQRVKHPNYVYKGRQS